MVVIALLSFALLAWLRQRMALAAILFLVPFGHLVRFTIAGVPFTFPEFATYLLAGVLVLRSFVTRCHCERAEGERGNSALRAQGPGLLRSLRSLAMTVWARDPWIVLPFLWVLVAAIAAAYSPNALRAWGIWKAYFLAPVIIFWTMRALRHQLHVVRHIIAPLAFGALGVAVIAIVQRWWPIGVPYPWALPGKFRATSVFGYPNAVGLYLAPLVPLFIGPVVRLRNLQSLWFVLIALLSGIAIWFAKSTGALVALAVALPILVLLLLRSMRSRAGARAGDAEGGSAAAGPASAGILIAWIALSLLLTAWLPYRGERHWGPPIVQKLTFQKWSGSVRLAQYRETWALLRDHPIRGAGLAGYQTAIRPYHEDPRVEIFLYPHNLLLAVWVELGLAGVLLFLAILYQFFRTAFVVRDSPFVIAAVLAILVHGLVDVPYFKNDLAVLFWVIAALAIDVRQRNRLVDQ